MNTDKREDLDPERTKLQPPIPTHPPDPAANGDAEKIVGGPPLSGRDPGAPPVTSTGLGSGPTYDPVGGPRLGEPPGEGTAQTPATTRDQDVKADDPQDRRDKE